MTRETCGRTVAWAAGPAPRSPPGSGLHSGLEMTLLQLVHWMLACGMVVVGLPWSERMRGSGSYYGATAAGRVTLDDRSQARELGIRLATFAARLQQCPGLATRHAGKATTRGSPVGPGA